MRARTAASVALNEPADAGHGTAFNARYTGSRIQGAP